MLEREGDVVERLEKDEAVIGREKAGERVGRERVGLGGDLAPARVGHARVDVAELEARHVHDEPARRRDRDVVLEVLEERALVR